MLLSSNHSRWHSDQTLTNTNSTHESHFSVHIRNIYVTSLLGVRMSVCQATWLSACFYVGHCDLINFKSWFIIIFVMQNWLVVQCRNICMWECIKVYTNGGWYVEAFNSGLEITLLFFRVLFVFVTASAILYKNIFTWVNT